MITYQILLKGKESDAKIFAQLIGRQKFPFHSRPLLVSYGTNRNRRHEIRFSITGNDGPSEDSLVTLSKPFMFQQMQVEIMWAG